jgi:hypothetical protein
MKSELKTHLLKNLADAYSSKELRVNEEYQRGTIWKLPQKQGFIDSLLRDYPLASRHTIDSTAKAGRMARRVYQLRHSPRWQTGT